jgi:nucleoside-specific outer membrane channel protein Tsx
MQAIDEVGGSKISRGPLDESQVASGYDYSESAQDEEGANVFGSGARLKLMASN